MLVNLLVIFLLSGFSALLSNQRIAIFNDQIRLELNQQKLSNKEITNKYLSLSLPLIIGIGITFTITSNILALFLIFWISDIVGIGFKKDKLGAIFSFATSGLISSLIYISIPYFIDFTEQLIRINYSSNISDIYNIFQIAYILIPILVIGYQFGVKKSTSAFIIILVCYILIYRFVPAFNPSLACTIIGFILYFLIVILNVNRHKNNETTFVKNFSSNITNINKKWYFTVIMGGLISLASFLFIVSPNIFAQALQTKNLASETILISIIFSLSILPSLLASTLISGTYSPYGMGLTSIWGLSLLYIYQSYFVENIILTIVFAVASFIGGGIISFIELRLIPKLTDIFEKYYELKNMSESIKKGLYFLFDLGMIIGSIYAIEVIVAKEIIGLGLIWCLGLYLINRNLKKKTIESYGVGPFALVSLVIILSLLAYLKIY